MKPHCDDVFSRLSFCNRPLRLPAIAIALLLLLPFGQNSDPGRVHQKLRLLTSTCFAAY